MPKIALGAQEANSAHGEGRLLPPYSLFESLISLYVEVCLYRDSTPIAARTLYEHDALAESFRAV